MWNAGWMKHRLESIAGRNINNIRYADNTTLMAESEKELKSLLMKVEKESEKTVLKLNIQNVNIMGSSPMTSWQIDGETVKTLTDVIFLGSKITADGDCSNETKRHFLLGIKAMTNLVQFSCSVVSDCLRPHGLHAACQASLSITNSRSLLKFMSIILLMPSNHLILCHPFSSCPQSFPTSRSFPMSQFFTSGGQRIGVSASASVLPMNIQDLFP